MGLRRGEGEAAGRAGVSGPWGAGALGRSLGPSKAGKGAGLGRAGWAECWGGLGWVWVELVGSLGVGLGVWAPFLISFLFCFLFLPKSNPNSTQGN